jgi:hypothetical protein
MLRVYEKIISTSAILREIKIDIIEHYSSEEQKLHLLGD